MTHYRSGLPQLANQLFLSDGGMETTLIFHEGIELPQFAAFVLLENEEGREHLIRYYEQYLPIAREHAAGFVLDTPTWRANRDWGSLLGYTPERLAQINREAVSFIAALRAGGRRRPCRSC